MPDDCRDVAAQLNANKKNRTYEELKAVLERFGFRESPRKTAGSHRIFTKSGCAMNVSLKKTKGPMLAAYVRAVVVALEECCDD